MSYRLFNTVKNRPIKTFTAWRPQGFGDKDLMSYSKQINVNLLSINKKKPPKDVLVKKIVQKYPTSVQSLSSRTHSWFYLFVCYTIIDFLTWI